MTKPAEPIPSSELKFIDQSLNPSQKDAVKFALESAEVALIHGPPGVSRPIGVVAIVCSPF